MKKFLAIYLGSATGPSAEKWEALDEATQNEREEAGMNGWMKWGMDHKNSITDNGSPLGKTIRINAAGPSAASNEIVAYTIVQAESHEAAAKLFVNHPHFTLFPGDSVEVMECLPIPGM